MIERIADLVNDKTIDDISDIRDESDRDGMRIVIELKRGAEPQIVLNQLFKHTSMQEGFSMILLAVVNGQPKEMGLIQAIKHFIDHRVDVVRRRTSYLLNKAKDREHILEGYLTALDHLDNVIVIIRGSANRADARENLVAYFGGKKIDINTTGRAPKLDAEKPFTAKQADAILELQLHRLTKLSIDEISNELKSVREAIAEYESILASEAKLRKVIIKELEEVKKLYGDARRTVIEDEAAEIMLEDLIADEQVAVTVSHSGYMKRTPISTYRMQRRGGTGRTGMKTRDEDFVEHLFIASTHAYILIFTNTGRVYWLKVYEIPDIAAAGKGKHVGNLVGLQPGETVRTMLAVRDLEEENRYVFFATHNGTVKKTEVKDFSHVMSRGIIAINIEPGDELVAASLTDGNQIVFLASHDGQAIRFDENDVRPMGRNATGVRGMNLAEKDYIVGMATTIKPEAKAEVKGRRGRSRNRGSRSGKRLAHSFRHRERIRQAHSRRRVSPHQSRRQRRDQRQDHGAQRQSRRHFAGDGEIRGDADQPVRQDHPHRIKVHPRIGSLGAGCAAAERRAGRSGSGGGGDSAGRAEWEWDVDSVGSRGGRAQSSAPHYRSHFKITTLSFIVNRSDTPPRLCPRGCRLFVSVRLCMTS